MSTSHAARTGLWVAPLHYRDLQRQQALLLHRIGWKPRHRISLSPTILEGPNVVGVPSAHTLTTVRVSHNLRFDLTVRTDASLRRWGAVWRNRTTGGRWSVVEAAQHINCLELKEAISCLEVVPGRGNSVTTTGPGPASSAAYSSGDGQHHCSRLREQERGGTQSPTPVPTGLGAVVFSC